jgi:putative spermidine/putrescine transport system ATP-binding protein
MSDRIAVFNLGKIEQIGTPAEIYEHPASGFVAGFVGTSNTVKGPLALKLAGREGLYALRPEKIHLGSADAPLIDGAVCAEGAVQDVIYLGLYTRYLVKLDEGDLLGVVQQNLHSSATDVSAVQGQRVRLQWAREHMLALK